MSSEVPAMLEEARQAIIKTAGANLRLLVLFGSEARGEATPESDIDLFAVLDTDSPQVQQSLSDAVYDVMWKYDFPRLISLQIMSTSDFQTQKRKGYSFVRNVEDEGVVLWSAA